MFQRSWQQSLVSNGYYPSIKVQWSLCLVYMHKVEQEDQTNHFSLRLALSFIGFDTLSPAQTHFTQAHLKPGLANDDSMCALDTVPTVLTGPIEPGTIQNVAHYNCLHTVTTILQLFSPDYYADESLLITFCLSIHRQKVSFSWV